MLIINELRRNEYLIRHSKVRMIKVLNALLKYFYGKFSQKLGLKSKAHRRFPIFVEIIDTSNTSSVTIRIVCMFHISTSISRITTLTE